MKTALPDNAKIAKEAKECMQECVSEFISFITSEGQSANPFWPRNWLPVIDIMPSIREMSTGETEDRERRGHIIRYDIHRV